MGLPRQIKEVYSSQTRYVKYTGTGGELVNGDTVNLFSIVGGDIFVTTFYGVCQVDSDGAATLLQLRIIPTGGAQQVLCAVSATLTAANIGDTLAPTGTIANALAIETTPGVTVGNLNTVTGLIMLPGIINVVVSGATDANMFYNWYLGYVPIEQGANVYAL